ncbi:hypothetical protein RRG08_016605 [Elysia crispata]|uniref:Amino acid permease/ SLC12A domain-containing protein n=1 Tax=Elysia crispata TaxID=231223 RepID=A0AAE0XS93_9GAST|nr:hypothetical protein RRG08_016605 [Elysia crispata]
MKTEEDTYVWNHTPAFCGIFCVSPDFAARCPCRARRAGSGLCRGAQLKYVLAEGGKGVCPVSMLGKAVLRLSLFPLPRVVQAMAQDGPIFRYFSHIHPKRQTAMRATVILGAVSAVIAATVDLKFLMELVLIATLLAYVIVTFAVVFILYVKIDTSKEENTPLISVQPKYSEGERAGQYDFDSSHRARETHSKHASKLRLSDSEASDDNASTSRLRGSRSATEKHDTIPALNVPSNSSKVRRHSDNAPPNGEEPGSHLKPHGQQTASSIERSKSSCRPNYQKACVPLLRPAALCLSTVARFLCDGRHISDFLKLLMFQSRKQITVLMVCIYAGMFVVCVILCHLSPQLDRGEPVTAVILTVSAGVAVVSTILLVVQPQIQR